ncbi:nucleotidyltransferase family protein [Oceanimonas sp. NS1]|nr:nucleotidyltransferase family protein [Oceanimonas sp. NS1]
MPRIATLIMAAGGSTRFGGCKLLASVNGMPLLRRSINTARQVTPGHVFTVTGAWHNEVEQASTDESWEPSSFIYHRDWARGLGSSIAAGVRHLVAGRTGYDAILVMLADQVDLTPPTLRRSPRKPARRPCCVRPIASPAAACRHCLAACILTP